MSRVVGSAVRIRALTPPGHIRTPFYLRGKRGVIERQLGAFKNPEQLAYGLPAPKH
ncbi:MAG: nitrile hydratase subunit beta, partial [Litoreibacter sp.]|nr:nitrile hydratase subunit beta [Litoreibacter sp.]